MGPCFCLCLLRTIIAFNPLTPYKIVFADSGKYPYPSTGSMIILNPVPLAFRNIKMIYPPHPPPDLWNSLFDSLRIPVKENLHFDIFPEAIANNFQKSSQAQPKPVIRNTAHFSYLHSVLELGLCMGYKYT